MPWKLLAVALLALTACATRKIDPETGRYIQQEPKFEITGEERHRKLRAFVREMAGWDEDQVIDAFEQRGAEANVSCTKGKDKGRTSWRKCRFHYNPPQKHPYGTVKLKFVDGRLQDWDINP